MKTINLTPSWRTAVRIYVAVLKNPDASPKAHEDAEADLLRLAETVDALNEPKRDDDLCGHKSQLYVDTYCIKPKGHLCAHQWPDGERVRQDELPSLMRRQAE